MINEHNSPTIKIKFIIPFIVKLNIILLYQTFIFLNFWSLPILPLTSHN